MHVCMIANAMLVPPEGILEATKNTILSVIESNTVDVSIATIGDAATLGLSGKRAMPIIHTVSSSWSPQKLWQLPRIAYDLRVLSLLKLNSIIKRINATQSIDVLHLHNVSTGLFSLALNIFSDIPIVAHIYFPFNRSLREAHHLAALKLDIPSHYICINAFLVDYLKRIGVKAKTISYIPCPIDTTRFRPMNNKKMKRKYGINENCKVVSYIGRITPVRDPWILVHPFKRLLREFPELRLLIAYPYARTKREEAYVKSLFKLINGERIRYRTLNFAKCEKIEEIYNLSDILVFPFRKPYRYMDPPLTLLEAMSCGKIVITSKVGEITHLIRNENNGFLINPGDADNLTSIMTYVLKNLSDLKHIGVNARETIIRRHSMKRNARKIVKIYEYVTK